MSLSPVLLPLDVITISSTTTRSCSSDRVKGCVRFSSELFAQSLIWNWVCVCTRTSRMIQIMCEEVLLSQITGSFEDTIVFRHLILLIKGSEAKFSVKSLLSWLNDSWFTRSQRKSSKDQVLDDTWTRETSIHIEVQLPRVTARRCVRLYHCDEEEEEEEEIWPLIQNSRRRGAEIDLEDLLRSLKVSWHSWSGTQDQLCRKAKSLCINPRHEVAQNQAQREFYVKDLMNTWIVKDRVREGEGKIAFFCCPGPPRTPPNGRVERRPWVSYHSHVAGWRFPWLICLFLDVGAMFALRGYSGHTTINRNHY